MYIKTQALHRKETTSDDTDRCLHLKMLHIKTGLSRKSRFVPLLFQNYCPCTGFDKGNIFMEISNANSTGTKFRSRTHCTRFRIINEDRRHSRRQKTKCCSVYWKQIFLTMFDESVA
jgi:hypothetical protein